jgi:hypothetical protein
MDYTNIDTDTNLNIEKYTENTNLINCITNSVIRASYAGIIITTLPLFITGCISNAVITISPLVISYPIEYIVSGNIKYSYKYYECCTTFTQNYFYFYLKMLWDIKEFMKLYNF